MQTTSPASGNLSVTVHQPGIALVELSRGKVNAIDGQMYEDIAATFDALSDDAAARGVLPLGFGGEPTPRPCGVGDGVGVGDLGDGVVAVADDVGRGSKRVTPRRSRLPSPPRSPVGEVNGTCRRCEDERTRNEHRWVGAGEIGWVDVALGNGHIPGGADERRVLRIGHRMPFDRESADATLMCGTFLGVEAIRTHTEDAAGELDKLGQRRRGGHPLDGASDRVRTSAAIAAPCSRAGGSDSITAMWESVVPRR